MLLLYYLSTAIGISLTVWAKNLHGIRESTPVAGYPANLCPAHQQIPAPQVRSLSSCLGVLSVNFFFQLMKLA